MHSSIALRASRGIGRRGDELAQCYEGPCTPDGTRSGMGKYTYPNRFYAYEGTYVDGRKQGKGRLTMKDGSSYVGDFQEDEMCGEGVRTYADGSKYTGSFHNGEAHGEGEFVSAAGWTYTGFFQDNRKHGSGTCKWNDGSTYAGEFQCGLYHGHGDLTMVNGMKYTGTWLEGKPHGDGMQTLANGDEYQGTFEHGQYHGSGSLVMKRFGTSYSDASFRHGKVEPCPERMILSFPEVVDKKKGLIPPEFTIGEVCSETLVFTVTIQSQAELPEGATTETGASGQDAQTWEVCTIEQHRPVTLRMYIGEPAPDEPVCSGACVEEPVIFYSGMATPASRSAAAEASVDGSGTDASVTGASSLCLQTVDGQVEFDKLKIGEVQADGSSTIAPGVYTLVFSSHGLPDAFVTVGLVGGGKGKKK